MMPNWPALLLAPSLALGNLAISYALTTPACARQSTLAPQLVCAVLLLACAWMSLEAWRNWRSAAALAGGSAAADGAAQRRPFVALVAAMVGALSTLLVAAQWFPQWVLSPCAS